MVRYGIKRMKPTGVRNFDTDDAVPDMKARAFRGARGWNRVVSESLRCGGESAGLEIGRHD